MWQYAGKIDSLPHIARNEFGMVCFLSGAYFDPQTILGQNIEVFGSSFVPNKPGNEHIQGSTFMSTSVSFIMNCSIMSSHFLKARVFVTP